MAARSLQAARPPFREALSRGLHLRCPCCGRGPLYRRVLRMYHECPLCGLPYYREPGYYVGAMIVNYGVTAFALISIYLVSLLLPEFWHVTPGTKIIAWMFAAALVSLALVPHARSLWLAVDYWIEPWPPAEPLFRSHARRQ
jgi:uncharacterized protein (DUF983 family)